MSFTVDGREWRIPCKIERTAEVTASEVSGMLLDKTYFADIIGTYLRYTITVAVPFGMEQEYAALYEKLIDPVAGHTMVLPYNSGTITITARIETVSDEYVRVGTGTHWRKTTFTAIALNPTKSYTLGEAVAMGLAPMPEEGGAQIGELYQYTADGWVLVEYENADNISY